ELIQFRDVILQELDLEELRDEGMITNNVINFHLEVLKYQLSVANGGPILILNTDEGGEKLNKGIKVGEELVDHWALLFGTVEEEGEDLSTKWICFNSWKGEKQENPGVPLLQWGAKLKDRLAACLKKGSDKKVGAELTMAKARDTLLQLASSKDCALYGLAHAEAYIFYPSMARLLDYLFMEEGDEQRV
ncbi:hypothetical protein KEM55_007367, partial [Ascosphaera atra]